MPFNGAGSGEQLAWLKEHVDLSVSSREKLLVFTHAPLCPDSCVPTTLVWNYDEVLAVLRRGSVAAGHDHAGGYNRDSYGTHHITLPSPLHTTEESLEAHGTVEVYDGHLKLNQ
ncbi:Manganese-dependent ADP-ribose/CDP-alcohol diphosphatase [Diplonema papillatum]|nr:Manganese-dependent ADP-ribose/CDP-alcohol diphosphatase [Diplonema papillatum]